MYVLVLFLSFSGFLGGLCFGRYLGRTGTGVYTTTLLGLAFLVSLYSFYEIALQSGSCYITILF